MLGIEAEKSASTGGSAPQQPQGDAFQRGYRTDAWPDQERERTLRQSESTRIY